MKSIFRFDLGPHKRFQERFPIIDGLSKYMSISRLHATEPYRCMMRVIGNQESRCQVVQ